MSDLLRLLNEYIRGAWRFRWWALLVAWAVCMVGWAAVYSMPNVYEAKARFYVDASSRLREVVKNLGMEPDVSSRVFLVRQAMLGRPQLEKVARETDLDLRATTPEEQENLIFSMLERIEISTGRTKEAQNLFSISFQDRERSKAVAVVQELLDGFVEDVVRRKDSETERAGSFLQEQLDHYRNLLSQTEKELETFKKQHPGFVPGDRGGYFERLQREREKRADVISFLRIEDQKRRELLRQLEIAQPADGEVDAGSLAMQGNPVAMRISELERLRRELLLRVTEKHPDIVALDEQLEQLREQLETDMAGGSEGQAPATLEANPVAVEIQIALSKINLDIAAKQVELAEVDERITELSSQVDIAPELERQYQQLTRDYGKYKGLYDEVLVQTERERLGRVGEERDVVSFNIVDPPNALLDPVAPNRPLLLFVVLVMGLLAGAGTAVLMDQSNPVFHDSEALRTALGLPVIGVVARLKRPDDHPLRRGGVIFAAGTAVLLVVFTVVLVFNERGSEVLRMVLAGLGGGAS